MSRYRNFRPGETSVQVITNCGTPQSQSSNAEMVTIQATAPEFFYFVHTATGQPNRRHQRDD